LAILATNRHLVFNQHIFPHFTSPLLFIPLQPYPSHAKIEQSSLKEKYKMSIALFHFAKAIESTAHHLGLGKFEGQPPSPSNKKIGYLTKYSQYLNTGNAPNACTTTRNSAQTAKNPGSTRCPI
jgi:hypothetical protein